VGLGRHQRERDVGVALAHRLTDRLPGDAPADHHDSGAFGIRLD
jgi:hypothetical protein